jgi:hypothetical protein
MRSTVAIKIVGGTCERGAKACDKLESHQVVVKRSMKPAYVYDSP